LNCGKKRCTLNDALVPALFSVFEYHRKKPMADDWLDLGFDALLPWLDWLLVVG
jgi:hypothetical protein